jgi:hypothetical protein
MKINQPWKKQMPTESESDELGENLNTRCHRNEHVTRKSKDNMAAGTVRN